MAKSHNGWKKLSGTGKRKIERILAQGDRTTRRFFIAAKRHEMERGTIYAA
jgi:hypothetical protein